MLSSVDLEVHLFSLLLQMSVFAHPINRVAQLFVLVSHLNIVFVYGIQSIFFPHHDSALISFTFNKLANVGRKAWPQGWTIVVAPGETSMKCVSANGPGVGSPLLPGATVNVTLNLSISEQERGNCFCFFSVSFPSEGPIPSEFSVLVNA